VAFCLFPAVWCFGPVLHEPELWSKLTMDDAYIPLFTNSFRVLRKRAGRTAYQEFTSLPLGWRLLPKSREVVSVAAFMISTSFGLRFPFQNSLTDSSDTFHVDCVVLTNRTSRSTDSEILSKSCLLNCQHPVIFASACSHCYQVLPVFFLLGVEMNTSLRLHTLPSCPLVCLSSSHILLGIVRAFP